jgi:uncharacterized protein YjbI with pentapeptide repeats/uncharacterized RDD family membrane protein YckC
MASPSIKRGKNQEGGRPFLLRLHLAFPLVTRRYAAVFLEVSLVAASALVPYSIGLYAKDRAATQPVPLNPVLAAAEEAIAKTLAQPREQLTREVAPLTNLFWCGALVIPVIVTGWQIYRLGKTGKTTPKDWLGVQVVTAFGTPPGLVRALWREAVGRWGLPVGTAYLLWRYTGAFPDVSILLGLAGLMLLAECGLAAFDSRRRTLHDKLAGTYVVDANESSPSYLQGFQTRRAQRGAHSVTLEVENGWEVPEEGASTERRRERTIATIVLTSQHPKRQPLNLWLWMRHHPGLTLLIMSFASMVSILGTFVATQIYIQSQANRREFKKQDNQVFLALVKQLSSKSATAVEERQGAILALARLDDSRAIPFLVDLLGQEKTPSSIDSIQQSLVSKGSEALPALRRLIQALQNDRETLQRQGTPQERQLVALRQQAAKRAIAKILTIDSDRIHNADLSRTNLSQISADSSQFTLVLDNLDLAGINFRSSILAGASLRNSRFYGSGEDGRFGTFDDWVTDLSGADLRDADLTGASLNNILMNRTNLVRATLNRANLSNSRLGSANLSSAQLIGANLRQAILENASLTGANLGEAKLTLSNLQGASLGQVNAVGGDFSFANLTQSNWQDAELSRGDLSNANLQEADLSSTKLVGANFSNAKLQNAKLRNANLSAADLRGANLAGADFQGVTFAATPLQSNQIIETPSAATLTTRIKGVNFAKVKNLDTKQIKFICSNGGLHPQCPDSSNS